MKEKEQVEDDRLFSVEIIAFSPLVPPRRTIFLDFGYEHISPIKIGRVKKKKNMP